MDKLMEVFNKMSIDDFKIGDYYWVHITHINSPHDFYVRPTDYKYNMALLERRGEKIRSAEVFHEALVIYKSVILNKYVRGKVLEIQKEGKKVRSCDFMAIDYGCKELKIPKNEIYQLDTNSVYPPIVINCKLGNCEPLEGATFNEEAIGAFKTYVGNERARMLVLDRRGKLVVELVNTCPNDIAMLLALTSYTTMGATSSKAEAESGWEDEAIALPCEVVEPVVEEVPDWVYDKVKHAMVVVGEVLYVRTQSGSSLTDFYVAKHHAYKNYEGGHKDFSRYCRGQKPFSTEDAVLGQFVGMQDQFNDRHYLRAIITQIKEPQVAVKLIDWGNTVDANLSALKLVKNDHHETEPAIAIYCTVERDQMADENLLQCLEPGFGFYVKIRSLGNSFITPHTVSIILIHNTNEMSFIKNEK